MPYENKDRKEVHAILDEALGQTLISHGTSKAYGFPADEAGTITLRFSDGTTFTLSPTGYEADGIAVYRGERYA